MLASTYTGALKLITSVLTSMIKIDVPLSPVVISTLFLDTRRR
jgi:hypothetical protein